MFKVDLIGLGMSGTRYDVLGCCVQVEAQVASLLEAPPTKADQGPTVGVKLL